MDYMGVGDTFDATRTFLPAGQSAGLVREIKPAGQIVRDIVEEAQQVIESSFLEPSLQKQKA
jgi:NAD(P)H-dependent flavin oxidoreductase YrpB (nitropropane dioxygenase family)